MISAEGVAHERAAASGLRTATRTVANEVANEVMGTVMDVNAVGSETAAMVGTASTVGTDPGTCGMAEVPTDRVAVLAPVPVPTTATPGAQTDRATGATKARGVRARQTREGTTRECTRFFLQYRKVELVSVTWWRQSHQARAKAAAHMRLHQSV